MESEYDRLKNQAENIKNISKMGNWQPPEYTPTEQKILRELKKKTMLIWTIVNTLLVAATLLLTIYYHISDNEKPQSKPVIQNSSQQLPVIKQEGH